MSSAKVQPEEVPVTKDAVTNPEEVAVNYYESNKTVGDLRKFCRPLYEAIIAAATAALQQKKCKIGPLNDVDGKHLEGKNDVENPSFLNEIILEEDDKNGANVAKEKSVIDDVANSFVDGASATMETMNNTPINKIFTLAQFLEVMTNILRISGKVGTFICMGLGKFIGFGGGKTKKMYYKKNNKSKKNKHSYKKTKRNKNNKAKTKKNKR
jgi:hypothetical protein